MQELSDRDRSIVAYAAVVRGFHTFFGAVIVILALLHLFVLLPLVEVRTAAPTLKAAIERVQTDSQANAEAQRALASSSAALVALKKALEAAPAQLSAQIGTLVARAQNGGSPLDYAKATVRAPREPAAAGGEETIPLADGVRRVIGKMTEMLGTGVDGTLGPLRALRSPTEEVAAAIRIAQEGLGHNILALNEVLGEAFSAEPGFWQRLGAAGATFAAVSPRGSSWQASTVESIHALENRLASASSMAKTREGILAERLRVLEVQQTLAGERLAGFTARIAWIPVGLELWMRLYPIIAGALALTVLVRWQRVMVLRRALGDGHLDQLAPSWIIGPPGAPGRWWGLTLVATPLVLSAHAAFVALRDADLFVTPVGERSVAALALHGTIYAAIAIAGLLQLAAMLRSGRADVVADPPNPV